ncbi:large ribosomal subunit protein bL17m-like [Diadema antillarum]|uniref:large ribosomal subunit protein bL17m-like n=1 Tax=Diadema antillarum TaxID=105358 RepID=UPI003A8807EC
MRRIKFKIKPYLRFGGSPENRVNLLQAYITALVKYERIELGYMKAYETQKYAERLITVAKRGDRDPEAMKIADFWLKDKKQVHKLFKVLGPRFEGTAQNFTRLLRVPGFQGDHNQKTAFLEYIGNPYPPLTTERKRNSEWLLNVLVRGAVEDLKSSRVLEEVEASHAYSSPLPSQLGMSGKQYHDNLDGLLHAVDKISLEDVTNVDQTKARTETSSRGEGTPV